MDSNPTSRIRIPDEPPKPHKVKLDRQQAFLLYATFCGDVERTAHALNVEPLVILRAAEEEGWNVKLQPIIALKRSTRPGDVERAINRALNFVQAHRFRLFLERIIQRFADMDSDQLEELLFPMSSIGLPTRPDAEITKRLSTRAFADLASALEKAQALTYMALNDTAQERVRRHEDQPTEAAGDMHAQIAKAMAEAAESSTPRAALLDAQVAQGQAALKPKRSLRADRAEDRADELRGFTPQM